MTQGSLSILGQPPDVLAVVGSEHWPADSDSEERVKEVIRAVVAIRRPDKVISGGAAGVDTWAIQVAKELGIDYEEFRPKNRRWAPDGFKARNIVIARTCTRLLAVRSRLSTRYGSGWTADYAERLGKPVRRVII